MVLKEMLVPVKPVRLDLLLAQTANETFPQHRLVLLLLLLPHLVEGIDYNTQQEVYKDKVYRYPEGQVEEKPRPKIIICYLLLL